MATAENAASGAASAAPPAGRKPRSTSPKRQPPRPPLLAAKSENAELGLDLYRSKSPSYPTIWPACRARFSAHLQLELSAIHQRGISMDAQRTSFVLTIAALLTGTALAAPPSESAPVRYTRIWSKQSARPRFRRFPSRRPIVTETRSTRIRRPLSHNRSRSASRTASTTRRTRSATALIRASAPRDNNSRLPPQTPVNKRLARPVIHRRPRTPSQHNRPLPPRARPHATWRRRRGQPVPAPPSPPTTSSWDSSTPVTPVDRSVLTNPPAPQPAVVGRASVRQSQRRRC